MRQESEPFDQDSGYALAVAGDGLALVTLGSTTGGASALVDAGSRDLWNDGFTACSAPSGGYAQIDNPTQAQADNPALAIGDGEVAVAYGDGPEDVMDIGYHYLGAMRFPSAAIPREIPDFDFPTAGITRDLHLLTVDPDSLALLAPLYEDSSGLGATLAVMGAYTSTGAGGTRRPLMVWDFEAGALFDATLHAMPSPSNGETTLQDRDRGSTFWWQGDEQPFEYRIDSQYPALWTAVQGTCVTAAAGANATRAAQRAGTLFLATVVVWDEPYEHYESFHELYVWRSTDGGENWSLIGARLHPWATTPGDWAEGSKDIGDVALVTNNEHLWVFWTESPPESVAPDVLGTVLPFAADPNQSTGLAGGTFSTSQEGVTGDLINFSADAAWSINNHVISLAAMDVASIGEPGVLDAVFDFAWGGALGTNDGTPAITYRGSDGNAYAARVELNQDGDVVRLLPGSIKNLTENGVSTGTSDSLAITSNPRATSYTSQALSLHTGFHQDAAADDVWGRSATTTGTADSWTQPPAVFGVPLPSELYPRTLYTYPDVTWRFDGRVRQFTFAGFDHIASNADVVPVDESATLSVTTNAENLIEPYLINQGGGELTITRLDP